MPLAFVLALLSAPDASSVVMTRDLTGSDPGTLEEWLDSTPAYEPLVVTPLFRIPGNSAAQVAILVEEGLADSLSGGVLEQWAWDVAAQEGEVLVAEITWSEPGEIRAWLTGEYATGLEGVILVGDAPAAWVCLDNAFLNDVETFPVDYFYMDLDGGWEDRWTGPPSAQNPGADGIYDSFTGNALDPEIYCGRIQTSQLSVGSEGALLQAYLERDHIWRTAGDPPPYTSLCYVDDDWAVWGPEFQAAMQLLYPSVELVDDLKATCGTDYETVRLPFGYQWISPFVHSSPLLHQWNPGPDTYWYEVAAIDPPSRFYNLFACSNARFTTPRNMGCIYAFATSTGLASVGSTKTGSMLSFEPFYGPMGQGANLGEGFENWWDSIISGGFTASEMSWHLGMVVLGDPTLIPGYQVLGIPGSGEPGDGARLAVLSNPSTGSVSLQAPFGGELAVYDLSGRERFETGAIAGQNTLDLSGLPAGVYTVVLTCGTEALSARLTVLGH
jgi:hypothetical protein